MNEKESVTGTSIKKENDHSVNLIQNASAPVFLVNNNNGSNASNARNASNPDNVSSTVNSILKKSSSSIPVIPGYGKEKEDLPKQKKKYHNDKGEFPSVFSKTEVRGTLITSFPSVKLRALKKHAKLVDYTSGPYNFKFADEVFSSIFFGRAISTYPHLPGKDSRDGDPICDSFLVELLDEGTIVAVVADGCNWGRRPLEASNSAKNAFTEYFRNHLHELRNLKDVGQHLANSISYCHWKICEDKEDIWEAGTTTMLGGCLLRLRSSKDMKVLMEASNSNSNSPSKFTLNMDSSLSSTTTTTTTTTTHSSETTTAASLSPPASTTFPLSNDPNNPLSSNASSNGGWVWACVSIGDCKCYHFSASNKKMTDLTSSNRKNSNDAKDCGGRLGPYVGEGEPDLRNVVVQYCVCEQDDLVVIVSDGVHDNLDPEILGKMPCDIDNVRFANVHSWKEIESHDDLMQLKQYFMLNLLYEMIVHGAESDGKLRNKIFSLGEEISTLYPEAVTSRILRYCLQTTSLGREWMEQNPKSKLPMDYIKYPGKMDHTTCVVIRVDSKLEEIIEKTTREKSKE